MNSQTISLFVNSAVEKHIDNNSLSNYKRRIISNWTKHDPISYMDYYSGNNTYKHDMVFLENGELPSTNGWYYGIKYTMEYAAVDIEKFNELKRCIYRCEDFDFEFHNTDYISFGWVYYDDDIETLTNHVQFKENPTTNNSWYETTDNLWIYVYEDGRLSDIFYNKITEDGWYELPYDDNNWGRNGDWAYFNTNGEMISTQYFHEPLIEFSSIRNSHGELVLFDTFGREMNEG